MLKCQYTIIEDVPSLPVIVKYKSSENLKYLESKFVPNFLDWLKRKYWHIMQCNDILNIILLMLYDPNGAYKECIHHTIDHSANLRVCLRTRHPEEKWTASFMYRLYVIRALQELMDIEDFPFRIDAYKMVISYLRDTSVRCITIDKYCITVEDMEICFNLEDICRSLGPEWTVSDDFDFTERIYFSESRYLARNYG